MVGAVFLIMVLPEIPAQWVSGGLGRFGVHRGCRTHNTINSVLRKSSKPDTVSMKLLGSLKTRSWGRDSLTQRFPLLSVILPSPAKGLAAYKKPERARGKRDCWHPVL